MGKQESGIYAKVKIKMKKCSDTSPKRVKNFDGNERFHRRKDIMKLFVSLKLLLLI